MKKILTFCIFIFTLSIGCLSFFDQMKISKALDSGWYITVPTSINFTDTAWVVGPHAVTVDFTDPIVATNDQGSNGGFTMQVTATEFTEGTDPSLYIGYNNLEVKTGTVTTDLPDGITTPLNGAYSAFDGVYSVSDPIEVMTADNTYRNAGSWSVTPSLRLTIPLKQNIGSYSATITFSLI